MDTFLEMTRRSLVIVLIASFCFWPATRSDQDKPEISAEQAAARQAARLIEMIKLQSRNRSLTNWEIVEELVKLGAPVVPALISEMEKADSDTMALAMYSLGLIGDTRAIVPLYNLLPPVEEENEEGGTNTKAAICLTLSAIGDVNSIPLVMQGPYAANRTLGAGAISYVGACAAILGKKSVDPLSEVIKRYADDKKVYGAITALGKTADERAIPLLQFLLGHQDNTVKMLAISALGQIGDPSVSSSIIPFLDSKVASIRDAAAESMSYLRDKRAIKKLCTLTLTDEDSQVRLKSVIALGTYGGNDGFQALVKAADDSNVSVRVHATECLGKSGNKDAAAAIKKKIKDVDNRVGIRAVIAYEKLLGQKAGDYLINVLNDTRWVIQREAMQALVRLDSKKAAMPIVSILRRAVEEQEENPDFRGIVLDTLTALSEIADPKTLDPIKQFAPQIKDSYVKGFFDAAINDISIKIDNGTDINKWIETLRSGDPGGQAVAIDMLGKIGSKSATQPLIEQFGKMDADLSSAIPKSLGKIKDPAAIPFLEDLLTNTRYGEKKIYPARANASWALGELKSKSSLKPLKDCLFKYDGEPFPGVVAIAKIAGKDAIQDLHDIKTRIMRSPTKERMKQFDDTNTLIRNLKNGWSISSFDIEP